MIDWIRLFQDHSIHYITSGVNVSKGNIGLQCPFCGADDPSQHMGVHLTTGRWNCWRDAAHRGTTPYRLISALLGVSGAQARLIAQAYTGSTPDEFESLGGAIPAPDAIQNITLPPEFQAIKANSLTHKFWDYLHNRGFDNPDKIIEDYLLKCCLVGRWKGRLIIPVYEINGAIIGWQGRSLRTIEGVPRYLTSHPAVKQTIYNLQNLSSGEYLYICEGPFDSIKIDYYGKPRIRATCLFGATPTAEQIEILHGLNSKFSKLIIILDSDATGITAGFSLSDWLPNASFGNMPEGHKDTDKLNPTQMKEWLYGKTSG